MSSSCAVLAWFIFVNVVTSVLTQGEKVRMCYFTNWSQYRLGVGQFTTRHIDPILCTHILYAFAHIDAENNTLTINDNKDARMVSQIMALKELNPRLKVLLAVGGGRYGTKAFEEVSSSKPRVMEFASNVLAFLKTNGFDGVDIDWEFPTMQTRELFHLFVQRLGFSFIEDGVASGREKLLLTIAVSGSPATVTTIYQPTEILHFVDYVLLMTYDLWGTWSTTLGHHSPLHPVLPTHPEQGRFSMSQLVTEWMDNGAPRAKLVPGLATYGRTGVMGGPSQYRPGDLWARHMGTAGPITRLIGFLSYFETCHNLRSGEWKSGYSTEGRVPYAWNPTTLQYLCYDDPQSFQAKAQYIVDEDLGGAMFWTLDYDDFSGSVCQQGKYPLIRRVKAVLSGIPDDFNRSVSPAVPSSISSPQAVDNDNNNNENNNNNNNNNNIENNNTPSAPPAQVDTKTLNPSTTTTTTTTTTATTTSSSTTTTTTEDPADGPTLRNLPSQSNMAAATSGLTFCVWVVGAFCLYQLIYRCCWTYFRNSRRDRWGEKEC